MSASQHNWLTNVEVGASESDFIARMGEPNNFFFFQHWTNCLCNNVMCIITLRDQLPELKSVGNRSQLNTRYATVKKRSFQNNVIALSTRAKSTAMFPNTRSTRSGGTGLYSVCDLFAKLGQGGSCSRCLPFSTSRGATLSHRVTVR